MIALVLFIALILILCAVIALASWGATTAATGLTLGASNAALATSNATLAQANTLAQTTISFLICVFVALLPLIVFGAIRLGVLLGERKRADAWQVVPRIEQTPTLPAPNAPLALPEPRADSQPQALTLPQPRRVIRRARAASRTRRANAIAKRWFR
jgi:hypothetical protein